MNMNSHKGANGKIWGSSSGQRGIRTEFGEYTRVWFGVVSKWVEGKGKKLEDSKAWMAIRLYGQRGKHARSVSHAGMAGLAMVGLLMAPVLASGYAALFPGQAIDWEWEQSSNLLAAEDSTMTTLVSDKPRDKVIDYEVVDGDTLSGIAKKFGITVETIEWENDFNQNTKLKPGQKLRILPVTGVRYKVKKGETIYSIAKKFEAEPQAMVDFPFNNFANDETFALAIGQEVIVPDGVMPAPVEAPRASKPSTPSVSTGGAVSGSGQFVWPAAGRLTQNYSWYHQGLDIANREAPNILAADSGRVIVAGWPDNSGYGNRVVIDHGNGLVTLYGHMSAVYVSNGQYVNRGEPIGKMGSTGRSTGTHLHFEIRKGSARLNPFQYLK